MAKLSNFYDSSTPEVFKRPRMKWDDVRVIDVLPEFGAGTTSQYVRRLIRKLNIEYWKNDDGNVCIAREDVEVLKDWNEHHGNKLR